MTEQVRRGREKGEEKRVVCSIRNIFRKSERVSERERERQRKQKVRQRGNIKRKGDSVRKQKGQ